MSTHPPTTPPSMTVAVTIGYVAGCAECVAAVEGVHAAALRDLQVTSFLARPGKVHAHAERPNAEPQMALGVATTERSTGLPVSDTNGSHPALVERALFAEAELRAAAASLPNGIDAEAA